MKTTQGHRYGVFFRKSRRAILHCEGATLQCLLQPGSAGHVRTSRHLSAVALVRVNLQTFDTCQCTNLSRYFVLPKTECLVRGVVGAGGLANMVAFVTIA